MSSSMAAQTNSDIAVPGISPAIFSADDFANIVRMVHRAAGINLADNKRMLVYSRLAPLLRKNGCESFSRFLDKTTRDMQLIDEIVEAITTHHTFFYREPHHYEHFVDHARPHIVSRLAADEAVRMWSAGCSSGQETWTLAMTLLGEDKAEGTRIAQSNIRLLASDIAQSQINHATNATYTQEELAPLPETLRRLWTVKDGDSGNIAPLVQKLVRFRQQNLLDNWPFKGRFQVIFCRNTMIYFDRPTREKLLERFARQMEPGGFLYIGHSERVSGSAEQFLEPCGPTVYRRRDA